MTRILTLNTEGQRKKKKITQDLLSQSIDSLLSQSTEKKKEKKTHTFGEESDEASLEENPNLWGRNCNPWQYWTMMLKDKPRVVALLIHFPSFFFVFWSCDCLCRPLVSHRRVASKGSHHHCYHHCYHLKENLAFSLNEHKVTSLYIFRRPSFTTRTRSYLLIS
ncbi:hypothetical protein NE237_006271 [Protea cynaroides]|uniref:Uncharacterized protein n=1 Tax=Protea cynaroides TaxID=273540 RepID=A0A9Q0KM73_9MAGN|nr:hypothetical protein NE237_006271 [Protea cynaroides]